MKLSDISVNTHSSIRIAGDKVLYFDPFEVQEQPHDADYIFITHEHFDHFQPESIAKVKKEDTVIIAPASMEKTLRKEAGIENYVLLEPKAVNELNGLRVEAVPAYNCLKPFHVKSKGWLGYLVTMGGVRYYIAGDTDVNEDVLKVRCDVALVPAGGKYTMDARQAAELVLKLEPEVAIPMHYGSVAGKASDGIDFKNYIEASGKAIQVELKL